MLIDGRAIATDILAAVRERVAKRSSIPVVRAIAVRPTGATESYLRIKGLRAEEAGMRLEVVRLEDAATLEDVHAAVRAPGADAVIVQLPLPSSIDTQAALDAIPRSQDADVLSSFAYEHFVSGNADALFPPVVAALEEVLERADVSPKDKHIVVVGKGRLVGEPVALWLSRFSSVDTITRDSGDLSLLKEADLVVLGAGEAGLVKPEHLKEGVVLIDAGTSESDGAIKGDADPSCATVASVFTPVPGGMGPIAVACLFKNVAALLP